MVKEFESIVRNKGLDINKTYKGAPRENNAYAKELAIKMKTITKAGNKITQPNAKSTTPEALYVNTNIKCTHPKCRKDRKFAAHLAKECKRRPGGEWDDSKGYLKTKRDNNYRKDGTVNKFNANYKRNRNGEWKNDAVKSLLSELKNSEDMELRELINPVEKILQVENAAANFVKADASKGKEAMRKRLKSIFGEPGSTTSPEVTQQKGGKNKEVSPLWFECDTHRQQVSNVPQAAKPL